MQYLDLEDYNEQTDAVAATIMGYSDQDGRTCPWDDVAAQELAERIATEIGIVVEE
jgi:hypothetical protein